jgi:hypothetical protein
MSLSGTSLQPLKQKYQEALQLAALGAPAVIRTRGLRIRSPLLYPSELQAHDLKEKDNSLL